MLRNLDWLNPSRMIFSDIACAMVIGAVQFVVLVRYRFHHHWRCSAPKSWLQEEV
jgi:hypothetical protein